MSKSHITMATDEESPFISGRGEGDVESSPRGVAEQAVAVAAPPHKNNNEELPECAICLGRDGDCSGTIQYPHCTHAFCLPCLPGTWKDCPLCDTPGKVHYKRGDREPSIVALRDGLATAKKNNDTYNRRVIHIYLSMTTLSGGRGTLDDMDEAAIMLNDAYRGFQEGNADNDVDRKFSPYGPEFSIACAEYVERAILCERGSLQLTTAIDDNLTRWINVPDCHYSSSLQHSMGKALRRLGRVDDAVLHLQRSTEIDAESPENWGNLGIALRQRGDLQQADEAQRKAIALAPDVGIGHYNMGNVLIERNELQEALTSMDEAVEYGLPPSMESAVERAREVIREALKCRCSSCKQARQPNKKKRRVSFPWQRRKKCKKTAIPIAPWLILILDSKGNCELTNEDGSAVNSDGSRMVFGGEVNPKMIMEHYGVRIRRVDRVNYPLV